MYRDDLRKELRMSTNRFYVSLHRLKKEFEDLGVEVFEHRKTTHQIRLAVSEITLENFWFTGRAGPRLRSAPYWSFPTKFSLQYRRRPAR